MYEYTEGPEYTDDLDFEDEAYEPDLDFGFEHDSAMTSIGWGTDEDYGYYGEDEYYGGDE